MSSQVLNSMWIRATYEVREEKGEYHLLVKELRLHDAG